MVSLSLPRPLSHSSLSLYAECPQKYKFKYIDKIPEKPRHFFSFGSSVHQALEFFYGVKTLPAPSREEMLEYYKAHWLSAGYKNEAQEAQYFEDGKTILTLFYQKHILDYSIPFFVEYKFDLSVDGVPVTGRVDRVDKLADGRLAIIDYKTGKALSSDRAQGDEQLTMYQMACEQLLGASVARLAFYHLPTLREHVALRHSLGQVARLKERIVTTAQFIGKGLFEPKPEEKKCYWCDYKPICPVFKHQYPASVPVESQEASSREPDAELSEFIDRYGQVRENADQLHGEAERLKATILSLLEKKGYVKAFGKKYEICRVAGRRWEFPDKKKVLEIIKQAGLYDRILAPSAPKVEQLMEDPQLDLNLKSRLEELGEKIDISELKVKPIS